MITTICMAGSQWGGSQATDNLSGHRNLSDMRKKRYKRTHHDGMQLS